MRCASSTLCLLALLGIGLAPPVSAQEAAAAPPPSAAPAASTASTAAPAEPSPPASASPSPAAVGAPASEPSSPTAARAPASEPPSSEAASAPAPATPPASTSAPEPTATSTAVPAAAAVTPVSAQTAEEAFNTRVKTLEEQVVDLKEKIYRSKARLLLLQETVLAGDISSGARTVIRHKTDMGSSFVLDSVSYALDGAPIFTRVNEEGELDPSEGVEIFNGRIIPGQHQVSVRLTYRGNGYGVFSYLDGYKFKVQSSYTFSADAGKVTTLTVVGFEKGGFTTDLKDRPAVRYDIEVERDPGKPAAAPEESVAPTSSSSTP
ncbi:dihydrolipoamide acetyltransferase [Stigmatella sp. ncwal1]|uniref:Dihydrolipoamide acetyltransferase n=1 Tax=Stigmatella ashevillensis TaxID=2995309 RepID=A0ABT5DMP2_9BACT|nr:dihydrolipoamide acetyltransferase [Stigmatella ashevillena]MDC0714309.1 dihydrolipoamide acetyltransferase [Stigmatella ashevillena]